MLDIYDSQIVDLLFDFIGFDQPAKLCDDLLQIEALAAFFGLLHNQPDAYEVSVSALEICDDLISLYFGLVSLESAREQSQLLDVLHLVE